MISIEPKTKEKLLFVGKVVLMLLFALACRQPPLYSSNQNTYFLHGLTNAGVGYLNLDWIANTVDPFPVFSYLVSFSIRFLGGNAFYIYKIILTAINAFCIVELGALVFNFKNMGFKYLTFYLLLAALYSGLLASFLIKLPGQWWSYTSIYRPYGILTWGAAEQYIHGPIFQPSSFGVFILASILAFYRKKPILAIILLAISVTFHSSYLLSAAVLTSTYMGIIIVKEKAYRKALLLGAMSLVLVLPTLIYSIKNFGPTNAEIFNQAESVLVNYAIPFHALASVWLDNLEYLQIILVGLSLLIIRKSKLFPVLVVPYLATIILSAIQIMTGNKSLALLFPWRISVFLVPIATSILFAGLVSISFKIFGRKLPIKWFVVKPVRFGLFLGGMVIMFLALFSERIVEGAQSSFGIFQIFGVLIGFAIFSFSLAVPYWQRISLFFHKRGVKHLFQLMPIILSLIVIGYLGITNTITTLASPQVGVNGSTRFMKSTYHPGDIYLIPPELDSIRIAAGIPIFVDLKSHPFKDTEILEWYDRIKIANKFYAASGAEACSILQDISSKYGITHVVTETTVVCQIVREEYKDENFIIYRVNQ